MISLTMLPAILGVCPVSVVADVKSSAGFGAVGGLAIDGDVIEVVAHLLIE